MIDEVQQTFVRSFIDYLKKQINELAFKPDAQESCEVAIQCLQAAFDLGEEEAEEQSQTSSSADNTVASTSAHENGKKISLFDLYEAHYLEKNPEVVKAAETIKNEGNRLMKNGLYNEALLQYNRAITYDPKNPIFYCNRAAAYIRLGDNERAVTDCKSALVYNPNYGKAYGRLGIAYSNLGKYEEAQQAYTKAIELEPDNEDYHNNLEVARNSRNTLFSENFSMPQLAEGVNYLLENTNIRDLSGSAELDLQSLQSIARHPAVQEAISQMFTGMRPTPGAAPNSHGDLAQLFQRFVQNVGNAPTNSNRAENPGNNQPPSNPDQKQPPSN